MAAMLATALAAIAETGFVGSMGVPSLAGMALVFPLVMLQQMLSAGAMGGGVSSAVSRALGAGDTARAGALAVHAIWIGLAAGLVSTAAMLSLGPALYALLGGRGEALAQAVAYSNVAFIGAAGIWMLNTWPPSSAAAATWPCPRSRCWLVAAAAGGGGRGSRPGLGPCRAGHGRGGAGAGGGLSGWRAVPAGLPAQRARASRWPSQPRRCSASCCATSCASARWPACRRCRPC